MEQVLRGSRAAARNRYSLVRDERACGDGRLHPLDPATALGDPRYGAVANTYGYAKNVPMLPIRMQSFSYAPPR